MRSGGSMNCTECCKTTGCNCAGTCQIEAFESLPLSSGLLATFCLFLFMVLIYELRRYLLNRKRGKIKNEHK